MSLNPSKVAPEPEPEREAGQEPGSEAHGPGPERESGPPAGPGPEPEPPSAAGQDWEPERDRAEGPSAQPPPWPEAPPPLPASKSENLRAPRPSCHTNCLEARLSRVFRRLGRKVGAHPWIFLLLPVALTAVLGTGLMYLPRDGEEDLEEKYTPIGSPAKAERRFMQGHFTANDFLVFSISRKSAEVPYASVLVVSNAETLLEPDILEEISKVDDTVQALTVTQDNGTQIPYSEVCAKNQGSCVPSTHSCSPGKGTRAST
ncbi:unnamed protein product [Rangifer tarandus platyrhynchus]|uniref:Patched domain containing 3 n=1 Tax=Rangifer tarandus platyrhynchus TaxID=3082113 RepID=A0ABN9A1Y0_RANTA|nr:unnamed protein product [Rangifer tarandus platyrhynchus]